MSLDGSKTTDVNKDWTCKDKDKDQAYKDRTRTRTRINITVENPTSSLDS